jgi:tetratricopeptide (TPR) repeat protein
MKQIRPVFLLLILSFLLCVACSTNRYSAAEDFLKQKEYNQAIRAYLQLLQPHMKGNKRYIYYDREAVTGVGVVYWHMQNYRVSTKILHTIWQKDPTYGKALFYLGLSLEGLGREDQAIKAYKKYVSVSKDDLYRDALIGRLDWLFRRQISRDIQLALKNENQLQVTDFPEKSITVLSFLSLSEDSQWEPLRKGLAEMIITDLAQIDELTVIERMRLNMLMDEIRLSSTSLIDENTAPRIGKLLGARYMVKGSYMVTPDLKMTIDANIFRIDEIYAPDNMDFEGTLSRLFKMEKELVLRILDYFKISLNSADRKRILVIPTENMLAFMNYCWGLDAEDKGDYKKARENYERALKYDPNFQVVKDKLISEEVWEATHNQNLIRVDQLVTKYVEEKVRWSDKMKSRPKEAFFTTRNRLQRMGTFQNMGFIPGNDTRKSFQEAYTNDAPVLPEVLDEPPAPPNR